MKKVFCLTLTLLSIAVSAFAGHTTAMTSGTTVTPAGSALYAGTDQASSEAAVNPTAKASTGVSFYAVYGSGAYSINTKHLKGSKVFGTSNDSTNIYWKASPAGNILTAAEGGAAAGDVNYNNATNGWTAY